ncbi:hypothetical protein KQ302_11970 [Synechococcus sp. CS-602]|uniref:hypothetical protein n=1 Tax=Synechococcaceae TaxID=1890426 RepID=UPI0008FF2580|nr:MULTISPECIES: hypothetical protein [Synechococcaceae]MCT4364985.1 hypothetical protein [Candidatus Regnicoccus frigidus MAG-AL1]APD47854.1 hypothetical protein BM449_05770 [Synechococcus sp. SynAce01]MCT0202954.1 hypothetical protein [Synechococcus sp. CS-603]MCT0205807.1 hypothetical protein [Synechococcus sp. CS-602]MCT0245213.1 hypothetical protein [Synechococcus sp. CS-601]
MTISSAHQIKILKSEGSRSLTLSSLSQLAGGRGGRKGLLIHFLLDSCLNTKPNKLFDRSGANLRHANLSGIQWDALTQRPSTDQLDGTKNKQPELKQHLKLN